jgi:hypothetical protein
MPFPPFPPGRRAATVLLCATGLTTAMAACQSATPVAAPVAATGTVAPAPPATADPAPPPGAAVSTEATTTPTGASAQPAGGPVPATVNCQDAGIRVDTEELGAAMGRQYHVVRLTNTGSAPCWVEAFPDVTLLDGAGIMVSQAQRREVPWTRVTVAPGGAAHLVLKNNAGLVDTDRCTARPSSARLRVLRALFFDRELPFATRVCEGAADQFTITPWAPGPAAADDEVGF